MIKPLKPYMCEICKVSFAKSEHLKTHLASNERHEDINKMKRILAQCLKQPEWKRQGLELNFDDSEEDDLEEDVVFDISLEENIEEERERTFIMLKPDAVQRGLVGEIIKRFEQKGFKLVAMKMMHASVEHLEEHYADLKGKGFFPGLIKYMNSGPVVPMVWQGLNVVKTGRVMLGETNPTTSAPGTIRGDFSIQVGLCHGSDDIESANKEIALWFKDEELIKWDPVTMGWVYEDFEPTV